MKFNYPPGATPLDPDEIIGLIPKHITTQEDLNEWESENILKAEAWAFSSNIQRDFLTIDFTKHRLKTPYRNGTTHVVFEPLDFISKLAALVPSPRVNLTRFFGVFAPNSSHRASIVIKKNSKKTAESETGNRRKAKIHDMGCAFKEGVQSRCKNLPRMWRCCQGNRLC